MVLWSRWRRGHQPGARALVPLLLAGGMAAAIGLPGCGGGSGDDGDGVSCDPAGTPALVIGGGAAQTGFVVLATGDPMPVVLGPQGLYMVTPSIRAQGLAPGQSGRTNDDRDPLVALEAKTGDTLIGASLREHLGLTVTADGAERLGIFLPFNADPPAYLNKRVQLTATVTDACGRTATGALEITAVP